MYLQDTMHWQRPFCRSDPYGEKKKEFSRDYKEFILHTVQYIN
jgi:hypothetical protein